MKKQNFLLLLVCILSLSLVFLSCSEPAADLPSGESESQNSEPESRINLGALRAETTASDPSGSMPDVLDSYTLGGQNYYLIDAGQIKYTFITSVISAIHYTGFGTVALGIENINGQTITEATTQTVTNSITKTDTNGGSRSIAASLELGYSYLFSSKFTVSYNREWNWSRSYTGETSKTFETKVEDVKSYVESRSRSLTLNPGDPAGYYRMALYATSKVYFFITTSADNQNLLGWETVVVADLAPDSTVLRQEFSENGIFDNSPQAGNTINFKEGFYQNLRLPVANTTVYNLTTSQTGVVIINNDVELAKFSGQYDSSFSFTNLRIEVAPRSDPLLIEFSNFGITASTGNAAISSYSNIPITISFVGVNRIRGGNGTPTAAGDSRSGNPGRAAIDFNGDLFFIGVGTAEIEGGNGSSGNAGRSYVYDARAQTASPNRGGNGGSGGNGGDGINAANLTMIGDSIGDITIKGGTGGNGGNGGQGEGSHGPDNTRAGMGGNAGSGGNGGNGILLIGNMSINLKDILGMQINGGTGGHGGDGGRGGKGHTGGVPDRGGHGGDGGPGGNGGAGVYFLNETSTLGGSLSTNKITIQGGNGGNGMRGGNGGNAGANNRAYAVGGNGGNGGNGGAALTLATAPTVFLQLRTSNGGNGGAVGSKGSGNNVPERAAPIVGIPGTGGQLIVWE